MSFDIVTQNFSASAELGYTFELKLPTGVDAGAKLTVIGDMSKTVKAFSRKKFQEFQQRQQIAKRKNKEEELSLDEAEDMAVEAALVRLIGWEGITENKKKVEFSKEKAEQILREHSWIREVIMQESADVSNFSPKV